MSRSPIQAADATTRDAVDAFVARVATRYPLHDTILFGSCARGDARSDSDADVAIVLDGPVGPFMQTKIEMADIAFDVMLDTGIRVQPLPIWTEQWRRPDAWMNPELMHAIARTGVHLWPLRPNP